VDARKTACIPYVGLVTQALTLIDEGTPTLVNGGLVNREKILLLWESWDKFSRFQERSYDLIDELDVQKGMLSKVLGGKLPTEEELYQLSYDIKPVASSHQEL